MFLGHCDAYTWHSHFQQEVQKSQHRTSASQIMFCWKPHDTILYIYTKTVSVRIFRLICKLSNLNTSVAMVDFLLKICKPKRCRGYFRGKYTEMSQEQIMKKMVSHFYTPTFSGGRFTEPSSFGTIPCGNSVTATWSQSEIGPQVRLVGVNSGCPALECSIWKSGPFYVWKTSWSLGNHCFAP